MSTSEIVNRFWERPDGLPTIDVGWRVRFEMAFMKASSYDLLTLRTMLQKRVDYDRSRNVVTAMLRLGFLAACIAASFATDWRPERNPMSFILIVVAGVWFGSYGLGTWYVRNRIETKPDKKRDLLMAMHLRERAGFIHSVTTSILRQDSADFAEALQATRQ